MNREKHRINLAEIGKGTTLKGAELLPTGLNELVERSLRLLDRIRKLDAMLTPSADNDAPSPVLTQINMLQRALNAG